MFKKSYNRAVLELKITSITPLLIRSGDAGLDPTASDMTPVRTHHAQLGTTVFIPGSSLKGVIRSAAEAAIRGRNVSDLDGHVLVAACDPLDRQYSCWSRLRNSSRDRRNKSQELDSFTQEQHRNNCLCCRSFGSEAIKGRIAIRDLFPARAVTLDQDRENLCKANRLEARNGVAIDRILGSASPNKLYDLEVVPAGVHFYGEVALENYQVWQLGLLAQAFDELNDGFAQLGSSKSRGLGVVKIQVQSILHEQPLKHKHPKGAGLLLADPGEARAYGLLKEGTLPESEGVPHGLNRRFRITEPESWVRAGLEALGGILHE